MLRRAGVGLAVMLAVAGLLGTAGAANAATTRESCPPVAVEHFGHIGWFICGTNMLTATWHDGHVEYFGIGTDHAVWHIASWFENWRSMDGWATDMNTAGYLGNTPLVQVKVATAAGTGYWCSKYTDQWSGWYKCDKY